MKSVLTFLLLSFLAVALFGVSAHAQSASEVVTASDIYWVTRLDEFRIAAVIVLTLACLLGFGCCLQTLDKESVPRALVASVVAAIMLCCAVLVFVPRTKEAVAMVVIPKIANNADVQGLGADTVNLAREWLDELRPASKKGSAK